MSLLDTLDPSIAPAAKELFSLAERAGVRPRVTSARRSTKKQELLYKAWVEGRSRYPAAPPGTSAHEYGLAFDLVVDNATDQADLGSVWTSWGGVYGGEEDPIHFQAPGFKKAAPVDPDSSDSQSIRDIAGHLADLLAGFLPPPLGGIVSIAGLAHAIYLTLNQTYAQSGFSTAFGFATWALSHPFEFFDRGFAFLWSVLWHDVFG